MLRVEKRIIDLPVNEIRSLTLGDAHCACPKCSCHSAIQIVLGISQT